MYFFSLRDFSDVWPRLASSFEVDRLLKRTFLHAIPVWKLHGTVSTGMFHISDLCVALVEFFPGGVLAKEKVLGNDFIRCYGNIVHWFKSVCNPPGICLQARNK